MSLWSRWIGGLRGIGRRDRLDDELQSFLESATEAKMAAGLPFHEARRAARLEMGSGAALSDRVRDVGWEAGLERTWRDIRYAARALRRSPGFTLVAVTTLALGIGANTAVFSIAHAALMRDLPVSAPGELVLLQSGVDGGFAYPEYRRMRSDARCCRDLVAASSAQPMVLETGADALPIAVKIVSDTYFSGLGLRSSAGRLLEPGDDARPIAVLGYGFWDRAFGRSPDAIGRLVRVNGLPLTIVGVAPRGFFGESAGESPDVYASMSLQSPNALNESGFTWLTMLGRLNPGTTREQASAELSARLTNGGVGPAIDSGSRRTIGVEPGGRGSDRLRGVLETPLLVLTAVVGILLLIACANLAGLLLSQHSARRPEIALRLALGASRGRIVRQLVTESLLLAAAGGLAGALLARWVAQFVISMVPLGVDSLSLDTSGDVVVWMFTTIMAVAATLLFGLMPAWRISRAEVPLTAALGSSRTAGARSQRRVRHTLIVVQVALSLVLVSASALFVRTLHNLQTQDLGFRADDPVLLLALRPQRGFHPVVTELAPRLVERLRAIPNVSMASVASFGALASTSGGVTGIEVAGQLPLPPDQRKARADWVGPGYFRTLGMPLAAGREFSGADTATAPGVAIVNRAWARHFLNGQAPVGQRFTWNNGTFEIVGLVNDAKYGDLRNATPPIVYFSMLQRGGGGLSIQLRTAGADPQAITAAARAALHDVEPRLLVAEARTLSDLVDRVLARERLVATLSTGFGALTLILIAVGVYGMLAYMTAQRTREFGVRLALGAARIEVVRGVLRDLAAPLMVGLALGAAGAIAIGRLLESFLFGVTGTDPLALGVAGVILSGVAAIAAIIPAVRASRIDPLQALRQE